MDEFKNKFSIEVCRTGNEIVVSTVLPTSVIVDTDVASILSYLALRYDVLYFCASICAAGLDRSVTFRLKDCYFNVKRFSYFLYSL